MIYCKELINGNIYEKPFCINKFKENLKKYKKIYCQKNKNNYKNNMNQYINLLKQTDMNYVKIGKYFLNHKFILQHLKNIKNFTNSDYLIVPGYDNCFTCEIQIGLSGSIKENEKPNDAINREVKEELGLEINDINFLKKIGNVYFYDIQIKNDNYQINYQKENKNHKDIRQKVSSLIHGKLSDLISVINKSNLPYHFNETISQICLIHIDLSIEILEILLNNKCNRIHSKGCRLYH